MRVVSVLACVALCGCSFAFARAPKSAKEVECSGVTTAVDFGIGLGIPAGTAVGLASSTPGMGGAVFLLGSAIVGSVFFVSALYGSTVEKSCREHNASVQQAAQDAKQQILAARERVARSTDCAVIVSALETLRKLDPASRIRFLQNSSVVRECVKDQSL
jgi:hypothetical protein